MSDWVVNKLLFALDTTIGRFLNTIEYWIEQEHTNSEEWTKSKESLGSVELIYWWIDQFPTLVKALQPSCKEDVVDPITNLRIVPLAVILNPLTLNKQFIDALSDVGLMSKWTQFWLSLSM